MHRLVRGCKTEGQFYWNGRSSQRSIALVEAFDFADLNAQWSACLFWMERFDIQIHLFNKINKKQIIKRENNTNDPVFDIDGIFMELCKFKDLIFWPSGMMLVVIPWICTHRTCTTRLCNGPTFEELKYFVLFEYLQSWNGYLPRWSFCRSSCVRQNRCDKK